MGSHLSNDILTEELIFFVTKKLEEDEVHTSHPQAFIMGILFRQSEGHPTDPLYAPKI